jgi:2-haloacid dehalogenase
MDRRRLLSLGAAGIAARWFFDAAPVRAAGRARIRAAAFDAFTVFDPRSVAARAAELFPGKGPELTAAWRSRQFEYTWLRTLSGRYADFWTVTTDALVYAARATNVELPAAKRDALMAAFLELRAYPDVADALRALRRFGVRLALLSNMTPAMLAAATKSARLEGLFELALSTDRVRAYKPDPRAYRMGTDALGLSAAEIAFAAFGGWDAAGARTFGYPTYWVNRAGAPAEELGVALDGAGPDLSGLVELVRTSGTPVAG